MTADLREIAAGLCRAFGGPQYVHAGGGNASAKDARTLWIKASGTVMSAATRDALVALDREKLQRVFEICPDDPSRRESRVKDVMMAAVVSGERPSVESPLHTSLDAACVVHTHPVLVGGLACSVSAAAAFAEMFPQMLWLDYTAPGYTMSLAVRQAVQAWSQRHGRQPDAVVQGNHGLIVAGETPADVQHIHETIFRHLAARYAAAGVATDLVEGPPPAPDVVENMTRRLGEQLGEAAAHVRAAGKFAVAEGPLSPDHIVYMKSHPLIGEPTADAINAFVTTRGYTPRIIACDAGVFAVGTTAANADNALTLARDGARVVQLAAAFGGPKFLGQPEVDFIDNWEVEAYRRKLAADQ